MKNLMIRFVANILFASPMDRIGVFISLDNYMEIYGVWGNGK